MENNGASCSNSTVNHGSSHQSQWLRQTLSDFNKRMGMVMNLLEEDEDSPARTEIYQAKRLELHQMLDEFSDSYRSLAEKHDHLRSKFLHLTAFQSSDLCPDSIMEYPDVGTGDTKNDFEYLNKLLDEMMSTEQCNVTMGHEIKGNQCKEKTTVMCDEEGIDMTMDDCNLLRYQDTVGCLREGSFKGDSCSELVFQVSKLMEENIQQQVELARRNIEKRVMINRLKLQIKHLKDENRAIQGYISCLKVGDKHSQHQISKLKKVASGKFFGLGCS